MRVILIAAQSLDGRITFHDSKGATFSSEADQQYFRATLGGFDCSVMGGETFRVSENAIRARIGENPSGGRLQVVVSRGVGVLHRNGGVGAATSESIADVLEFSDAPPEEIVADLRARGKKRCALLGGGQIYGLFLAAGVVDEVWLTLEPRIFGAGVPLSAKAVDVHLRYKSFEPLSADTVLLKYEVIK